MAKAPAMMASTAAKVAAPAAASIAKLPMMMPSAAAMAAKIPMMGLKGTASAGENALIAAATKSAADAKPWSWLEKQLGKRVTPEQQKMRDAGLGLMQMGMQQEQAPMQLAPFQPGGGGGAQPAGQGALMQLIQQYGLNKIQ